MTRRDSLKGTPPTSAELACLYLLERPGATYGSVARQLRISEGAVGERLRTLYARLDVASALQARAALESQIA